MSARRFVGLDLGITTTDVVAEWAEERPITLRTGDPESTASSAIEKLMADTPPPRGSQVVIAATGAGSHRLSARLGGFAVETVPELAAIGRGGIGVGGVTEALVVSLGTGTAMVSVRGGEMRHVSPGSGVGGGSLLGLARGFLGVDDLSRLADLARQGDRSRIDLTIGEATGGPLGALPANATASNLAKWSEGVRREDLAAGFVNLVAEVVLTVALLGLQASGQQQALLIGKLLLFEPIGRRVGEIATIAGSPFAIPPRGGIATALGALWTLQAGERA